jgi:hypothetical protein
LTGEGRGGEGKGAVLCVTNCNDPLTLLITCVPTTFESDCSTATHAIISHLVASLPTSRQQVVFALLVTSCQQVWNKLLTICNNLVDIIRLVTRLF